MTNYTKDLANYNRRNTKPFDINVYAIGGDNYIRLQSMTNTDTQNITATAEQIIAIAEKGADYVRITTPTIKDVEALKEIRRHIKGYGLEIPIVADIHFNPKVAIAAIEVADKIRINPGNLINSKRYTSETEELQKIEQTFLQIIEKAKKYNKAIRVGTNIGSLSERILNKYGATAQGLVAATIEYLDMCHRAGFEKVVVSVKASNALLNIQANRLLAKEMAEKNYLYPIHLGVTEAGSGIEGRVKSALGIGALLIDGIGDTVRVSLTEAPENEIPVARKIVEYATKRSKEDKLSPLQEPFFDPYNYNPRVTDSIIGNIPVVISSASNYSEIQNSKNQADFIYNTNNNLKRNDFSKPLKENTSAQFRLINTKEIDNFDEELVFLEITYEDTQDKVLMQKLKQKKNIILIFANNTSNYFGKLRHSLKNLMQNGITAPVVVKLNYSDSSVEDVAIKAAIDAGVFLVDGLINGLWIEAPLTYEEKVNISFEVLQASRRRISKAEFISCPGCGRTTFELEPVTEKIKARFSDKKGLKIAIMGCIVNGLGEMADADYAYVGTGKGKISLYYNRKLVKKDIPEELALDELEKLITETQSQNA